MNDKDGARSIVAILSRTTAEYNRLFQDHPDALGMSLPDINSHFWMYFGYDVAIARLFALSRRQLRRLTRRPRSEVSS